MLDLLILRSIFSLLDCMRNLPIIIYTKPQIQNDSLKVNTTHLQMKASLTRVIVQLVRTVMSSQNFPSLSIVIVPGKLVLKKSYTIDPEGSAW